MLFPNANLGWGYDLKHCLASDGEPCPRQLRTTQRNYYRFVLSHRLQFREQDEAPDSEVPDGCHFTLVDRLVQGYMVDMATRIRDENARVWRSQTVQARISSLRQSRPEPWTNNSAQKYYGHHASTRYLTRCSFTVHRRIPRLGQLTERPSPHSLFHKSGDYCFITRNLSRINSLNNGTKVQVITIHGYAVTVRHLTHGTLHTIPRTTFELDVQSRKRNTVSFTLLRGNNSRFGCATP